MKNNRHAPHVGRGDPPERSGSQGCHPVIGGVRGDPPWMFISLGDPPLVKWKLHHPPEVKNVLIDPSQVDLIFWNVGCKAGSRREVCLKMNNDQ